MQLSSFLPTKRDHFKALSPFKKPYILQETMFTTRKELWLNVRAAIFSLRSNQLLSSPNNVGTFIKLRQ